MLLLVVCLLAGFTAGAQQTLIDVKVDTADILVGEQTTLHVTVTTDPNRRIIIPLPSDTLMTGVEVISVSDADSTVADGRLVIRRDILVTSFDSSLYLLPPFIAIDGADTIASNQVALKVSTVPVDVDNPEKFYDIKDVWKPPFVLADYYPWIFGVLTALFLICSFGISFEMVQANTIAATLETQFKMSPWATAAILLILCGPIVYGGLKAVAKASEIVAPLMAIVYIGLAVAVVLMNLDKVGPTFSLIVENAFGLRETLGGLAGSMSAAMMNGVRRGLFSNEAGEGSAPNAASTAHVTHPAKQGLIQSAGVFVDTILVCSATAFILFNADPEALKPYWTSSDPAGADMTITALESTLGSWAGPVMVVLICVFAGSSVIGNFAYAEVNMDFLTKGKAWGDKLLKAIVIVSIVLGSVAELKLVWNFADLTMTGMALINIVSIVMLGKWAFGALQDYLRNRERPFVATGNPSMPGELPTDIWVHGGTDLPSGSNAAVS